MLPAADAPIFIVLNAGSGHEETDLRRRTIEEVLGAAGRRFTLAMVEDPEQLADTAERMVAEARAAGGIIVAAGGDGTINTVAHKALGSGCPFGVLPQGTFNYFGRTHHIPEDLAEAVRALLDARIEPVQIGMVNERIFLVNASIGLYPTMLEEREHDKRQYGRSRIVAFYSALKTILSAHRHLRIELELNGQVRKLHTTTLFVGNNQLQMQQLGCEPLSDAMEAGELAAIAPKPMGRWGLLGLLVRGLFGRLGDADDLVRFSFRRLTVRRVLGRGAIKVATDGEVCRLKPPLQFQVLEGMLLLLKPTGSGL